MNLLPKWRLSDPKTHFTHWPLPASAVSRSIMLRDVKFSAWCEISVSLQFRNLTHNFMKFQTTSSFHTIQSRKSMVLMVISSHYYGHSYLMASSQGLLSFLSRILASTTTTSEYGTEPEFRPISNGTRKHQRRECIHCGHTRIKNSTRQLQYKLF